jgi:hypothetical protein
VRRKMVEEEMVIGKLVFTLAKATLILLGAGHAQATLDMTLGDLHQ